MSSPSKSPTMDLPPSSVEQTHPLPTPSTSLEIVATTSISSTSPNRLQQIPRDHIGTSSSSRLSLVGEEVDEEEERNNFNDNEKNKKDASYLKSFPAGFRFQPRDDELVKFYLYNKIMGHQLPPNNIMGVDIYRYNPEDLAQKYESYGEKQWYFFTPRERKYRNGKRPNRRAGEGYWKATGADKSITSDSVEIGFKKALVYYRGKPPKGNKTNWIMHEFRLRGSTTTKRTRDDMRLDAWVLCRIYEKADKRIDIRNHEAELVEEDMYATIPDGVEEMEINVQIDNSQSTKYEEENTYPVDDHPSRYERVDPDLIYDATSHNNMLREYHPYFQQNALSSSFSAKGSLGYQNDTLPMNLADIISESVECKEEASYQNLGMQFPNQAETYSYEKSVVQQGNGVDHVKSIMGEALPSSDGLPYTSKEEPNDVYDMLSCYSHLDDSHSLDFLP